MVTFKGGQTSRIVTWAEVQIKTVLSFPSDLGRGVAPRLAR